MKYSKHLASYYWYFVLYNLCFWGLQLLLLYSKSDNLINSIKLPGTIYLQIIATLGIQFGLYLILSLVQTWTLASILKRPWHYFTPEQWQIIIWTLCICIILSANAYYFPLSIFSKLFAPPIPEVFIALVFCSSLFCFSLLLINALFYRNSLYFFLPGIVLFTFLNLSNVQPAAETNPNQRPNIFLLGIDSLSPASVNKKNMPFVFQLLNNSVQLTDSISPLARTYPAWSSILTGLYTEHHHAEENLVAKNTVNSQASIIWLLNQHGYNTIYATDDRRFNSIDKDFGFQKIIGPKTGVNDVILGSFNDFPLGNLLINFQISSWLFPYNYSNRASYFSYYPETFNTKLQRDLAKQSRNKPLFLAVHFALPHWPYAWAESLPDQVNNEFSLNKRDLLYKQAIRKVDKQYQAFYTYLEQQNYFHNSLVIILSDHGEVLYYPDSRLTNYHNYQSYLTSRLAEYLKNNTATELDKSAGHGSDILSPGQYHNVLAFTIYKDGQLITSEKKINERVALIDLAPTILSFLHIPQKAHMDGISLLPAILNTNSPLPKRVFYLESGMFPNQEFSKEKAIALGHQIFIVNPDTGELELKPDELKKINRHKLYGILSGSWILALYPDDTSYIPVIQNLTTGEWIDNLHSDFAKKTPAERLKYDLQSFYGNKLTLPIP